MPLLSYGPVLQGAQWGPGVRSRCNSVPYLSFGKGRTDALNRDSLSGIYMVF